MPSELSTPIDARTLAGVATLTLNRPDRLNSFTAELLDALAAMLQEAAGDPLIRAVVITGAGRGFCAGQDLTENVSGELDVAEHIRRHYLPIVAAIRDMEIPVIAAVNGVAAGAGLSLALACDLRIAIESATFTQAFVRIGLVPDAGGTWFLPRLVGIAKAMELSLLGETITAAEAHRIGLVNRVVADAQFGQEVSALADRLAHGPASTGLIKRALTASRQTGLEEQLDIEADLQAKAFATEDFREGIVAFVEKRQARFQGR